MVYQDPDAADLNKCRIAYEGDIVPEHTNDPFREARLRLGLPHSIMVTWGDYDLYMFWDFFQIFSCFLILYINIGYSKLLVLAREYSYPIHNITCYHKIIDIIPKPAQEFKPCIFKEGLTAHMDI